VNYPWSRKINPCGGKFQEGRGELISEDPYRSRAGERDLSRKMPKFREKKVDKRNKGKI
jgi:hypothetical protein